MKKMMRRRGLFTLVGSLSLMLVAGAMACGEGADKQCGCKSKPKVECTGQKKCACSKKAWAEGKKKCGNKKKGTCKGKQAQKQKKAGNCGDNCGSGAA